MKSRVEYQINLKDAPSIINPNEIKDCELSIVLKVPSIKYNYCIFSYVGNIGLERTINLKIPINILMFGKPIEGDLKDYKNKLEQLLDHSNGNGFELDEDRVKSVVKIREILSKEGTIKVYPADENNNRIRAAIKFKSTILLIQIDAAATSPIQCFMTVYCEDEMLRNTVAKAITETLGRNDEV